jgi:NOA36 protein.
MPKKKTGQRKKAEKMKLRQKEIRSARDKMSVAEFPCNANMVSGDEYLLWIARQNFTDPWV